MALAIITFGIQYVVDGIWLHKLPVPIAQLSLLPLIVVIANVQTARDIMQTPSSLKDLAMIALERWWAVLLIDFVLAILQGNSIAMMVGGTGLADTVLGACALFLTAPLLLADVFASVQAEVSTLTVIPMAILRSLMLFWQNNNALRLLGLLVLQLLAFSAQRYITTNVAHTLIAQLVVDALIQALIAAPFAVLTTVIYFDCLAREVAAEAPRP